jgi:CBS domain-containing protein
MNIAQIMKFDVQSCRMEDTLKTIAGKMWERNIGCLPVINATQQVIGMITDRDICMAAYKEDKPLSAIPVSAVMSKELFTCHPSDTVARVEAIMRTQQIRRLPVVDNEGKLVGIVSLEDIALEVERELVSRTHDVSVEGLAATLASMSYDRERKR